MTDYVITCAADEALTEIYKYTDTEFGESQAEPYFDSLEECLNRLAVNPKIGLDVSSIRDGYRRYVQQRYMIFYKHTDSGILVVRILGPGMLLERHLP